MAHSLFKSGLFADLTLILQQEEKLNVHKFIVCRCDFFKADCQGNFKVGGHGLRLRFDESKVDILAPGSTRECHSIPRGATRCVTCAGEVALWLPSAGMPYWTHHQRQLSANVFLSCGSVWSCNKVHSAKAQGRNRIALQDFVQYLRRLPDRKSKGGLLVPSVASSPADQSLCRPCTSRHFNSILSREHVPRTGFDR